MVLKTLCNALLLIPLVAFVFPILVSGECRDLVSPRVFAQPSMPRPGQAPRERILLMVIRGTQITLTEQQIRTKVRESIEAHLHAGVVSSEETFVQGGASFQRMLEDCRGEAPCYARLVGSVDARYLLVLSARKVRDLIVFGTRLIDLDVQKVLGKGIGRITGEKSLLAAIEPQLKKTIPVEMWDPYGSILIKVERVGAEVFINDILMGLSPLRKLNKILPGPYSISVQHEGYEPVRRELEVRRMALSETSFLLKRSPGILSKWWFWTGLGLLTVAGVASGFVFSQSSSPILCSSPDPNACP